MQKLEFAIIGPATQNTEDLRRAVDASGHSATILELKEIRFEMRNGSACALRGNENMADFDIIIFRGYNEHIGEAKMLAEMLLAENRTVIEESLGADYARGKMQQARRFAEHGVNHPATFQASDAAGWKRILNAMEFPIIAKPVFGRKGRGVLKLETKEEAMGFFLINLDGYLAQEYFPIESDYRVFVVGGKVVGGFQRFINKGEYKSNIHGTRAEKIEVGKKMEDISVAATKALGYEVAGVDLMEHRGDLYVIEANVAPQWEKFKLVTELDPAIDIIEYALEKHRKNGKQ